MRAKAYPGEDASLLPTPDEVAPLFVDLARPSCTQTGAVVSFRQWRLSAAKV